MFNTTPMGRDTAHLETDRDLNRDKVNRESVASHEFTWWFVGVLWFCIIGFAIGVVYGKHVIRQRVALLQTLHEQRDVLKNEWSRLLLEQSTWSAYSRIEQYATENLGMHVPKMDEVVIVKH